MNRKNVFTFYLNVVGYKVKDTLSEIKDDTNCFI